MSRSYPPAAASRLTRLWRIIRGALSSRVVAARELAEGRAAIEVAARSVKDIMEEAGRKLLAAELDRDNLRLELSSARATIADRDREIERQRFEKAAVEAMLELRKLEVEELNQWLERVRTRLDADIAQEVAREYRATAPKTPHSANQPPS